LFLRIEQSSDLILLSETEIEQTDNAIMPDRFFVSVFSIWATTGSFFLSFVAVTDE